MKNNDLFEFIVFILMIILVITFFHFLKIKNKKNEKFQNIEICEGKRDGVSGCRDCCSTFKGDNYWNCVNNCMN